MADLLHLGNALNPAWDGALASGRIAALGLDPAQKAGKLSGGQRAQLALTLALAKRPELLILDEPVARLDPLARREFLQDLQAAAAGHQLSVVLSSHLVADLEQACDYLIVLAGGRVQLTGEISSLLASHHLLTGPRRESAPVPAGCQVVQEGRAGQQATLLVRAPGLVRDPARTSTQVSLEVLVLAYMSQAAGHGNQAAEVTRCSG